MAPTKYPPNGEETRWSKTLESVRKDVECFFGILKGRFRILKLPILYRRQEDIDNMFFTCCILHNMLHSFDGLGELEENANWAGLDGLHDPEVADPSTDHSSVGRRSRRGNEEVEVEAAHKDLKNKLVAHFAYRRKRNDITWLSR